MVFFVIAIGIIALIVLTQKEAKPEIKEETKEESRPVINEEDIEVEPGLIENFPLRNPSRSIIKERWGFIGWSKKLMEFLPSLENFIEKEITQYKKQILGSIKIVFGADKELVDFEKIIENSISKGRDFNDVYKLYEWAKLLVVSENIAVREFGQTFLPFIKSDRDAVKIFLESSTVFRRLEESASPEDMVAHQFRFGHLYAYNLIKVTNLFTKFFREKIYQLNISENKDFDDVLDILFSVYYKGDLKYSKDDLQALRAMQKTFGQHIKEIDRSRVLVDGEGEVKVIWKIEDGAWRLDNIITKQLNPCKQKVRDRGLCDGYFSGYEFDNAVGKCIMKGVSGCFFETPFKTLKEYQAACEKQ